MGGQGPGPGAGRISAARTMLRGAVAGVMGTAVMTLAQHAEMAVTGRPPSTVPGQVAAGLLSRSDADTVAALSGPTHWAHGAAMGPLRGVVAGMGLRGVAGSAAFFALLWAGDAVLYRTLGIDDWPWRWSRADLATDMGHKALYALVTGAAYDALDERSG
jgi:hypothetical protein